MITIPISISSNFNPLSIIIIIESKANNTIRDLLICFNSMLLVVSKKAKIMNDIDKEMKMFFDK